MRFAESRVYSSLGRLPRRRSHRAVERPLFIVVATMPIVRGRKTRSGELFAPAAREAAPECLSSRDLDDREPTMLHDTLFSSPNADLAVSLPLPDQAVAVSSGMCIQQLFEAQAATVPDHTAVSAHGTALSYAELNRRPPTNWPAFFAVRVSSGKRSSASACADRSICWWESLAS